MAVYLLNAPTHVPYVLFCQLVPPAMIALLDITSLTPLLHAHLVSSLALLVTLLIALIVILTILIVLEYAQHVPLHNSIITRSLSVSPVL
jgi:hypothetical protein